MRATLPILAPRQGLVKAASSSCENDIFTIVRLLHILGEPGL